MRSPYDSLLAEAESKLGITLRRHTSRKACGPCPDCGGVDRFVVWLYEGNAWCSRCDKVAWIVDDIDAARRAAVEQRIERDKRISELRAAMSVSVEWQPYNAQALQHPEAWLAEGLTIEDISKWGLGMASACPVFPSSRSLTIPVFRQQTLQDIRHRLLDADPVEDGKYRSHLLDLEPMPFNLDAIYTNDDVIVVEGEKKAMVMSRFGWTGTVGIPGINSAELLLQELSKPDSRRPRVTIAFDPGANGKAERLALAMPPGLPVKVADCFAKPDDILNRYGPAVMASILKQARPVYQPGDSHKRH